jgi:hypothetical protein
MMEDITGAIVEFIPCDMREVKPGALADAIGTANNRTVDWGPDSMPEELWKYIDRMKIMSWRAYDE